MLRSSSTAWVLVPLLAAACGAGREVAPPSAAARPVEAPYRTAATRAGRFLVSWRPVPAPLPVNEPFELEVLVARPGDPRAPVTGAEIHVSGWMPDHEHGMLVQPRSFEVEGGAYRVRGMLLHMGGLWQLSIDVIHAGTAESADFELLLD